MSFASRCERLKREFERLSPGAVPVIAADFVTGQAASFARLCTAKGDVTAVVRRDEGEAHASFVERTRALAGALASPRLVVGGIDPAFSLAAVPEAPEAPQRGTVLLPDGQGLHRGQAQAARLALDAKRVVLRAGRRWGKSTLLIALAADEALRGRPVGYFSPLFKTATPVFDALVHMLSRLSSRRATAEHHHRRQRQRGEAHVDADEGDLVEQRQEPISRIRAPWGTVAPRSLKVTDRSTDPRRSTVARVDRLWLRKNAQIAR
jgi:hypothetical protein